MLQITRWRLFKVLAATLCVAGLVWLGMAYLIPAPPTQITIGTSPTGEHYHNVGTRYQGILAAADMKVELRVTNGAKENLGLLNDPKSGIQLAFMQGGISNGTLAPDLMSLGRIDHQIFWLFYPTGETLTDLAQLRGKRIGLGAEGSGDRAVCEKILAVAGITYDNTTLVTVAYRPSPSLRPHTPYAGKESGRCSATSIRAPTTSTPPASKRRSHRGPPAFSAMLPPRVHARPLAGSGG